MSEDGRLPLARKRLSDAVHSLADPLPIWHGDCCRWTDSVYAQLRGALSGGVVRGSNALRTAPLRVNVLSLLIEIDGTVDSWESDGKSTVDRLHVLAGRDWRPMDTELMDDYSA